MSSIAFLAFFLSYILAPTSPITWLLIGITFVALAWDTKALYFSHKEAQS